MGSGLSCGKMPGDFRLPNFFQKNHYDSKNKPDSSDLQNIMEQIAPGCSSQNIKNIATFIQQSPGLIFTDPHFQQLDSNVSTKNKLSKLYDYKRQRIDRLYSSSSTSPQIINQREVQLAYCSAVFYLICQQYQLKQDIILTRHVNNHHAYLFKFHCNGGQSVVAIDDFLPVQREKISFLNVNIAHGKELWPLLLEKAWVKQIGGYSKARGLSPEDCFEEITGVPAYSFKIKDMDRYTITDLFRTALREQNWVALTALTGIQKVCNRQIFIVQQISQDGSNVRIRSPYQSFDINGYQKLGGAVKLDLSTVIQMFEYATFGFFTPKYETTYLPIKSSTRQEVIVEINVKRQEKVNIRFQQFYQEYLQNAEKQFYVYSPVFMELYDQEKLLIESCQGIPESMEGIRSSHLSAEILTPLTAGKYYLRLHISWVNEKELNSGNLVVYSSPKNIQMKVCEQKAEDITRDLIIQSLSSKKANTIEQQEQKLMVRWLQKQYSYVLTIQNTGAEFTKLRVHFKGSQNICIKNCPLSNDLTVEFNLEADSMKIFEVVPLDPHEEFYLAPFDILKI